MVKNLEIMGIPEIISEAFKRVSDKVEVKWHTWNRT
jgi:hypothetical protein